MSDEQEMDHPWVVTRDNMPQTRQMIGELRQQKSKMTETLALIDQALAVAREHNLHSDVVNLFLEAALVWQHHFMEYQDGTLPPDPNQEENAVEQMGLFAAEADQYVKEHNLDKLRYRPLLFLGKAAMLDKNYAGGKDFFDQAAQVIQQSEEYAADPSNELELQGWQAAAMIRTGDQEGGLALAQKVFANFDDTDAGRSLQTHDQARWRSWRAGVAMRAINAALDTDQDADRASLQEWATEVEPLVDQSDPYRLGELEALRKRLMQ